MAGASARTQPVDVVNANWTAGGPGEDGRFALMVVTKDGQRHVVEPSPAATTALLALAASGAQLLWDPDDRTLIAGGVRGHWLD